MRPTRERKQTQGFNPDTDGANDTKRKAGASGQQPVPKKRKQAPNPVNGKVEKKKNTKESATTSRKTAGKAESKANSPKMWVVVVESAPSGYGCHRGPPLDEIQTILRTDRTVFKGFKSEREAIVKAKAERDGSCYFDDWSEEMYTETQPPPYDSRDGENYDNDDAICIYISDSLEYAERLKKEEERVEKARQKHIKAHEKQKAAKKAKLAKNGAVHYSWPPDEDLCIHAEMELIISEDGTLTTSNDKDKVHILDAKQAAQVKTLMIKPKPHAERFKSPDQGIEYQIALITVLAQFTNLEELHWHNSTVGEALIKRVVAETNLGRSLRTLSIPLARPGLCPEDVEALAGFTQLRKLALYSSLDDDGTCGGGYRGGYGSSDEQEKAQPFCGPLLTACGAMKHLKVLDIKGHMDYGMFSRLLTQDTIYAIRERGVAVEIGTAEHY